MTEFQTMPSGTGAMGQEVREVYADGVRFATLRPLGGTRGQYGIFLDGSTKRYLSPKMPGQPPDSTTIFGLGHAALVARDLHEGRDPYTRGAISVLAQKYLSRHATEKRLWEQTQAKAAAEAAAEPPPEAPAEPPPEAPPA